MSVDAQPTVLGLIRDICLVMLVAPLLVMLGSALGGIGPVELVIVAVVECVALVWVVARWVIVRQRD
jgi:hypothetical protein